MFGPKYLVAPVMYQGVSSRDVYLPEGKWRNLNDNIVYEGKQIIHASAPLEFIPVFEHVSE
jgi:alpha-D-xyloside xylohydrolase